MFAIAFTFLFGSFVAAVGVFMTLMSILLVFSGIYINSNNIPPYWIWMIWVSPFNYMFRAYFYLVMHGNPIVCLPGEFCPISETITIYHLFGIEGWTLTSATLCALGYMAGWAFVFFILAYFLLRYRRFS